MDDALVTALLREAIREVRANGVIPGRARTSAR
jgi:hypothetical protein